MSVHLIGLLLAGNRLLIMCKLQTYKAPDHKCMIPYEASAVRKTKFVQNFLTRG